MMLDKDLPFWTQLKLNSGRELDHKRNNVLKDEGLSHILLIEAQEKVGKEMRSFVLQGLNCHTVLFPKNESTIGPKMMEAISYLKDAIEKNQKIMLLDDNNGTCEVVLVLYIIMTENKCSIQKSKELFKLHLSQFNAPLSANLNRMEKQYLLPLEKKIDEEIVKTDGIMTFSDKIQHCKDTRMSFVKHYAHEEVASPDVMKQLAELTWIVSLELMVTFVEPPEEIGRLTNLESLSLLYYNLPEFFSSVGELKSLEQICLYGSALKSIPTAIGRLSKLKEFDPYTSYYLHWLPFEITKCPITSLRISTRSMYGNRRNAMPYPVLQSPNCVPSLKELAAMIVVDHDLHSDGSRLPEELNEFLESSDRCSYCEGPLFRRYLLKWTERIIAGNRLPLLSRLCSSYCHNALTDIKPVSLEWGTMDETRWKDIDLWNFRV